MRLAFVTICGYPWGGSEELWTATAKEALLGGHEVLVSVFDWPNQHERLHGLKSLGARMHLRRRFYPGPWQRVRKKLWNSFLPPGRKATYHDYLSDFQPDHILFSLAGGDEIAIEPDDLMVFVRQTGIPFSVIYHSVTPGHRYPPDVASNMREVFHLSKHSFFTSRLQMDLYRSQTGDAIVNGRKLHHPLRPLTPVPFPAIGSGPVRMCMVGSLISRWKGQDIAFEVLSSASWRDRDWELDVYGVGSDSDMLVALTGRLGISDRVHFKGHDEDMGRVLGCHHLVLIPSRQDTGPIVLFEAMGSARPVVGMPMGAMPEYVADGQTGFMSPSIDAEGFAIAMERAWAAREQWRRMGEEARSYLAQHYDPNPQRTLLDIITA